MFYICERCENGTYGIKDTEDGVVEYYTPNDIANIIASTHLSIKGVILNGNRIAIKVVQPDCVNSDGVNTLSFSSDRLPLEERGKYDDLNNVPRKELARLLKPIKDGLDSLVLTLAGDDYSKYALELLDGCDCIGYGRVPLFNTPLYFSIYVNPDFDGSRVTCNGVGIDIVDANGNIVMFDKVMQHRDGAVNKEFVDKIYKWFIQLGQLCSNDFADEYCAVLSEKAKSLINMFDLARLFLTKINVSFKYDTFVDRVTDYSGENYVEIPQYRIGMNNNIIGGISDIIKYDKNTELDMYVILPHDESCPHVVHLIYNFYTLRYYFRFENSDYGTGNKLIYPCSYSGMIKRITSL